MAMLNNQRVDKNRQNRFQTCPSTIINHQNHGKPGVLNSGHPTRPPKKGSKHRILGTSLVGKGVDAHLGDCCGNPLQER